MLFWVSSGAVLVLEKFFSTYPIFSKIVRPIGHAKQKETGAENQSIRIARNIAFSSLLLNRIAAFFFVMFSMKSFCNEAFVVRMLFEF